MRHPRSFWEADDIVAHFIDRSVVAEKRLLDLSSAIAALLMQYAVRSLADLGIGDGWLASHLLHLVPALHILGVDYSLELLALARARLRSFGERYALVAADLFEGAVTLTTPPDAFLLARTLHHMDQGEVENLFNIIRQCCAKNTKLIIVERWAFTPQNQTQATIKSTRLAIADAMFPGMAEFHHSYCEYLAAGAAMGFRLANVIWHPREIITNDYLAKVRKWLPQTDEELVRHLTVLDKYLILPTMLLVLEPT